MTLILDSNHATKIAVFIPGSLPEYVHLDKTRFMIYLTCANGYQVYEPLIYYRFNESRIGSLQWSFMPPDSTAGATCTVTSYDPVALGLTKATIHVSTWNATSAVVSYNVTFD